MFAEEMKPIPARFKKTGVAAYNTIPEAKAFAEEMTRTTGIRHFVTIDNDTGTAVVEIEKYKYSGEMDSEVYDEKYHYIHFDEYGLTSASDVVPFGDGEITDIVELVSYSQDGKVLDDKIKKRLNEYNKETAEFHYAVVFSKLKPSSTVLCVFRESAINQFKMCNDEPIQQYAEVYSSIDNQQYEVNSIVYTKRHLRGIHLLGEVDFNCIIPEIVLVNEEQTLREVYDMQFGFDSITFDPAPIWWFHCDYIETVGLKPTLWNTRERKEYKKTAKRKNLTLSKKLIWKYNKFKVCLSKAIETLLICLVVVVFYQLSYTALNNKVISVKEVPVTVKCLSQSIDSNDFFEFVDMSQYFHETYTLTDKNGVAMNFTSFDGRDLDFKDGDTIVVTVQTRKNGESYVYYHDIQLQRIE